MKVVTITGSAIDAMSQRRRQIEAKTSNTPVPCETTVGDNGIATGSASSVEAGPRVIRHRSTSACLMISTATVSLRCLGYGPSSSCSDEPIRNAHQGSGKTRSRPERRDQILMPSDVTRDHAGTRETSLEIIRSAPVRDD